LFEDNSKPLLGFQRPSYAILPTILTSSPKLVLHFISNFTKNSSGFYVLRTFMLSYDGLFNIQKYDINIIQTIN